MNNMTDSRQELECPVRTSWVSFRLVDESGKGQTFAGLTFLLHTQYGEALSGILDEDGYCRMGALYCGPPVLELPAVAQHVPDAWNEHLQLRKAFPLPLSALQKAAEQTPIGPRTPDGKTWLAEERAVQEGARFYRVEVSDFVSANKHLPDPDAEWGPRPSAQLKTAMEEPATSGSIGYVLRKKLARQIKPTQFNTSRYHLLCEEVPSI